MLPQRPRIVAIAALSLMLVISGCAHHPPQTGVAQQRTDTLWYATSRLRTNSRLGHQLADSIEYGYYRIASRSNVDVMRDKLHIRIFDSVRVTEATFLASVAAPSASASDVVILSVHGYATDHARAIRDAAEPFLRSGTTARWIAFSWPSDGHGVSLMPSAGFLITSAYRADSTAAVESRPLFAQLLVKLHATVGGSRLVVVAHSMGAQLATETLAGNAALRSRLLLDPLRAIGLFEPDVPSRRFTQYTVPLLRPITHRLALYASTNDGMLRFSSLVNRGDRAGLLSSLPQAIPGLEIVDITNGESSEDWFRRHFGTHHAMKKESGALRDFFDVVVAGRAPTCRVTNGTAHLRGDGVWQLLPARAANTAESGSSSCLTK